MLLAVPVVSAESIQLKVYGKTVKVSKWSESVVLAVNKKTAVLSGKPGQAETAELDATVTVINNRVYVPLRFLSEQYRYNVSWQNNTVSILSPLSQKRQRNTLQWKSSCSVEPSRLRRGHICLRVACVETAK
jgi:hypothetical protein